MSKVDKQESYGTQLVHFSTQETEASLEYKS